MSLDREQLDDWCEKGILGLVLTLLVYSPLALGAVRPQEFVIIQWLAAAIVVVWLNDRAYKIFSCLYSCTTTNRSHIPVKL